MQPVPAVQSPADTDPDTGTFYILPTDRRLESKVFTFFRRRPATAHRLHENRGALIAQFGKMGKLSLS